MICIPMGSPCAKPAGMEIPGTPAILMGRVQTSLRYIWSGLSAFSPILKGTVGEVGVTSASYFSKACVELTADKRADFLRFQIIGIVIAGR